MMLTSNFLFALLFLMSTDWLMTQATEPRCVDIADFENCQGNVTDFCPKGISCGCKDEMPYCKCPSYRVKWENYWYMGPKCNELWSTLDLIIMCSLPALALVAVVVVSMQWISYCCSRSKRKAKRHGSPPSQMRAQAPPNTEYAPNLADEPRYAFPQNVVKNGEAAPNFKFPQISLQYQPDAEVQSLPVGGFGYIPSQPLRKATSLSGNAYGNQPPTVQPFTHLGSKLPEVDYEEENPFSAVAMQQYINSSTLALPQPSYSSPQPVNYQNAERGGNLFKFGRPKKLTSGF